MNSTLEYIVKKFNLDIGPKPPIEIRDVNRTIMAETLTELNFKVGAEVGVAQGDHALMLCRKNPGVKLYCIDVWARYGGFREYTDRIDKYFLEAQEKLKPYNAVMVKKFSMDAVSDFADNSLDFVYIDAAHDFKNVTDDVCEWAKKVRVGGIVFGHDYKSRSKGSYVRDVKYVIPSYCYAKDIRPWFVLANGIRDDVFGRDNPAWLFVRQDTDRL